MILLVLIGIMESAMGSWVLFPQIISKFFHMATMVMKRYTVASYLLDVELDTDP